MRIVLGVLALAYGCKGGGDTDGDGVVWPEPKPWQVDGEEGNLVVTVLERAGNPEVEIYGVFADSTQGYLTAAPCLQGVMPCVDVLPGLDDFARANNNEFRPRGSEYRWVGDDLYAGPFQAFIQHDLDRDMAFYYGYGQGRPTGDLRVRLGGEWTDVDLPLVRITDAFTVTAPVVGLDERLDLSGPPVEFTWESNGLNEVWLWVDGVSTRRLYRLRDDGSFELDPAELGLDNAEVVDVGLAAASRTAADLDGNRLDLVGLSGAGWTGSECGAWLDVPIVTNNPIPTPMPVPPTFMGWGFRGIVDEGVHDFIDPDEGTPTSAHLYFTFFSSDFEPVCEIRYEADLAARVDPLIVESGANLFQSWAVQVFNGESTCGAVDPTTFGVSDLRDYVEQFDWAFAIGEVLELEEPLSAAFGADAWATQAPFLYSVYWSQDGLFADEQGYGYSSDVSSCHRGSGGVLPAPVPPDGATLSSPDREMPGAYYFTFPYYVELVP